MFLVERAHALRAPYLGRTRDWIWLCSMILVLTGFVWIERRAENPLLPLQALNSTVGFVLACIAAGWGTFGIWVFYSAPSA